MKAVASSVLLCAFLARSKAFCPTRSTLIDPYHELHRISLNSPSAESNGSEIPIKPFVDDSAGTFQDYSSSLLKRRKQRESINSELSIYTGQNRYPIFSLAGDLCARLIRKVRCFGSSTNISESTKIKKKGTLILVRGGESEYSENYLFTGWADPDITGAGE